MLYKKRGTLESMNKEKDINQSKRKVTHENIRWPTQISRIVSSAPLHFLESHFNLGKID
jgi:hypothetical protein